MKATYLQLRVGTEGVAIPLGFRERVLVAIRLLAGHKTLVIR